MTFALHSYRCGKCHRPFQSTNSSRVRCIFCGADYPERIDPEDLSPGEQMWRDRERDAA